MLECIAGENELRDLSGDSKWRSYEPHTIARLSEVFILRFTIAIDAPEEGSDVTLTEAGYINVAKGARVEWYGCEVVVVISAREFWEV